MCWRGRRPAILAAILAAALSASSGVASGQTPAAAPATGDACVAVAVAGTPSLRLCLVPGSGHKVWFKDCPGCPELVVAPAGRLPDREVLGERRVGAVVERPFAIGRFAVTFAQWDDCVAAGGCNGHRPADQGWGRGNRPVVNVSFEDATAYAQWLSARTGKVYRLPTDAERELATRAGTATAYWWGDGIDLDRANYDVPLPSRRMPNADYGEIRRLQRKTVPVDTYAANPWGLYNVHGNVWEWTADCFVAPDAPPAAEGSACGERIARGGSWNDFADAARSEASVGYNATARNPLQGFRIVRELP